MQDLITAYGSAIALRRSTPRGTPAFARAEDQLVAAFTALAVATGLSGPTLASVIRETEVAYAEDPAVAGSVVPGNAYPEDFIDRLAAALSGP